MAINVYLQDIKGKKEDEVYDLYNSLAQLWPVGNSRFPLLQYIDPYGNAVFNGSQMGQVLVKLNLIAASASTEEQRNVIRAIIDLASRCRDNPHLYLRFRGD